MENKAKQNLFHRIVDWLLNLILMASGGIIIWLLLIITTFSSFKVPTSSMEPTILPGDYILVNKRLIGARIFDVWESAEGKEVEISRLPGIRNIKRNDVVVFNEPYIVGVATRIWKSVDKETGKIRWDRVMKTIE